MTEKVKIKAGEVQEKKLNLLQRTKQKFNYPIKKMEVISGMYDLDKQIILNHNALIKAVCYYGITQKTQGNKEIMGWLVGNKEDGKINVMDAYVGNCESSSAYTEMDPLETIKIQKMAKERGMNLVGQWHTHPGMSTSPSGTDDDFMRNIEKMGIKSPVQLIVNAEGFDFSIMEKGKRRKAEFVIPPKTTEDLNINLGYMNGEYKQSYEYSGGYYGYGVVSKDDAEELVAFYGYVGNKLFSLLSYLPFVNLIIEIRGGEPDDKKQNSVL